MKVDFKKKLIPFDSNTSNKVIQNLIKKQYHCHQNILNGLNNNKEIWHLCTKLSIFFTKIIVLIKVSVKYVLHNNWNSMGG